MKPIKRIDSELTHRAEASIAHGSLTNSKRPQAFIKGIYPTHLVSGQGAYVFDTYQNRYIDFICGLGSNLIGYANEEITDAITKQARLGTLLSLGTDLEVRCAERVKEFFPFIERLRFLKTGSEACTAALTIARAATGRQHVLSEGYHGWNSEFTSLVPPAIGCPRHPYIHKLLTPDQVDEDTAAVIVEPIITDTSEARIKWLHDLRERCTLNGTVLIFDEIITGFRYPTNCVSTHYGVIPDLICLGKAMGGGMPLSVVGGSAEVMEGGYFVSSTFAGETLSLAAAIKHMDLLQNKFKIDYLWEKGQQFIDKFNALAGGLVKIQGYPTRGIFVADAKNKALFFQEACKAGILVGPSFWFIHPHTEVMDEVLSAFQDIFSRMKMGSVVLEGEMPITPYASKVRGNK